MKLSPEKVEQLSSALLEQLAETDGVLFKGDDSQLRLAMQQIISDELMVEERLDAEAVHMVRTFETDDHKGAAAAFVEKRPPTFVGK